MQKERFSRFLGSANGWRSKRLRLAIALRKQGWSYQQIGEHLSTTPRSIGRDIKCFVIKSKEKMALQIPATS
jgi:hypothetical protein